MNIDMLQQPLPFTACAAGCRTVEEQYDGEVRRFYVPKQSEDKTKNLINRYGSTDLSINK